MCQGYRQDKGTKNFLSPIASKEIGPQSCNHENQILPTAYRSLEAHSSPVPQTKAKWLTFDFGLVGYKQTL